MASNGNAYSGVGAVVQCYTGDTGATKGKGMVALSAWPAFSRIGTATVGKEVWIW